MLGRFALSPCGLVQGIGASLISLPVVFKIVVAAHFFLTIVTPVTNIYYTINHHKIDLNFYLLTLDITMQAQPVFSNYMDSYIDEVSIYGDFTYSNNQLRKMPTTYLQPQQQMGYPHEYQGHGVQIVQQEEESYCGNVGMWGLENMMVEGTQKSNPETYEYPLPLLSLATTHEEQTTPSHPDMISEAYSNESSPCMDNYMLPSAPRTPVTPVTTPLLNGQYYTVPGVPGAFVLVPVMARDLEGNYTTVFYPKPTVMDSCLGDTYSMGFPEYGQDTGFNIGIQCAPQEQQSFVLTEENGSYMVDSQDDGPELVGMGLYDEPPELLYSTTTTPELARLNTPGSNDGRGLVLEQSFGLPEEEEYDYEDEEEEVEVEQQCMTY